MKAGMLVSILILVSAVLIITVSPWGQVQADDSDTSRSKDKVIFQIGKEGCCNAV